MHRLLNYMDKVVGDKEKEQKLREIVDCFFERVKHENPKLFYGAMTEIHILAYGCHFDCDTAKMAVSRMRNVDGSHGEHWTMEETDKIAEQHNIKHKADFYYSINMMWSDYSTVLGKDTAMYVNMAKAHMCDPDAHEGKVFCSWIHKMEEETE